MTFEQQLQKDICEFREKMKKYVSDDNLLDIMVKMIESHERSMNNL